MFHEKNGVLYIEDVCSTDLVESLGTPLYVTSRKKLEKNIEAYKKAFPKAKILYAVKANNNLTIMKIIAQHEFGADVFSDGELYMALLSGFKPEHILFNGNSKSDEEIQMGISTNVQFSIDSLDELYTISKLAKKMNKKVKIAFRVNPEISVKTHPKIATALKESKFGLPEDLALKAYKLAKDLEFIQPVGVHCHIGSQILDLAPFREALTKLGKIASELEKNGIELEFLDIGGGLGIDYTGDGAPSPKDLADEILPVFDSIKSKLDSNIELWLEPGRSIVGDTTILLTKVNAVKSTVKKFVAVDAGFNLLIRPVLYGAYHRVEVANKMKDSKTCECTIVGPICEAGDILAENRILPEVRKGDILAIFDVGAYGFVMSSQYNGRRRCAEVLVSGKKWYIIRERETYQDLISKQILPAFLEF